jgi:hypothetical protein
MRRHSQKANPNLHPAIHGENPSGTNYSNRTTNSQYGSQFAKYFENHLRWRHKKIKRGIQWWVSVFVVSWGQETRHEIFEDGWKEEMITWIVLCR